MIKTKKKIEELKKKNKLKMILEKKIEEEAKKIKITENKKTILENEENNLLDKIKKTTKILLI